MNVRVDLSTPIYDGMEVVFKAPCDAAQVTGLNLYYPKDGVQESQQFAFADANANDVGDIDALFAAGAVVKVILDLETHMAFIQNADTNSYLEERFKGQVELDATLSKKGKAADAKAVGDAIAALSTAGGGGATEVYTAKYDPDSMELLSDFQEMEAAFIDGKIVTLSANTPDGVKFCFYCTQRNTEENSGYEGATLTFSRFTANHIETLVVESGGAVIPFETNLYNLKTDVDAIKEDMGDIDVALDAIIAIQNSLIGGGGA